MRFTDIRLAAVPFVALCLSGCVGMDFGSSDRFQTDFHYMFDLKPGGRVNVESFNGSIEIIGWDDSKVEISGVKYASSEAVRDEIKIDAHNTPESIDLRTVRPSGGHNMGARYTLHVPRTAVLERITTSNGSIRVKDVASAAHLTTSNSSIRAENFAGGLDAHTSNGSIEIDSVRGDLTLRTNNSRIEADNIDGACEAVTGNGGIGLTFRKSPSNPVRAHTSNSGITIHLPAGSNARVRADTSNGSIHNDFALTDTGDDTNHHLEGSLGSGGPMLELKTSNGGIRIVKGGGE